MKKILIAVAISAAFSAMPAAAQGYVGIGAGNANTDANHTSYKAFAGMQANQNIGAEIAYNDFGNYRGAWAESWSIAGVGTLPLNETWDVIGKLGVTSNHSNFAGSTRHSDILVGLGVAYNFAPNMAVRLEYEDFGKLPAAINGVSSKANNLGLNLKYSF